MVSVCLCIVVTLLLEKILPIFETVVRCTLRPRLSWQTLPMCLYLTL